MKTALIMEWPNILWKLPLVKGFASFIDVNLIKSDCEQNSVRITQLFFIFLADLEGYIPLYNMTVLAGRINVICFNQLL